MQQTVRGPAPASPHYKESYYDEPYKNSTGFIREERQNQFGTPRRTYESTISQTNAPHNQQLMSPRMPYNGEFGQRQVVTYSNNRVTRSPMSGRGMPGAFEYEDSGRISERSNNVGPMDGMGSTGRTSYLQHTPNRYYGDTGRSFADEFSDDYSKEKKISYRDVRKRDMMIEKLKLENKKLLDEVHKYKKMEVGMSFGSTNKKTFEIADLKMQNKQLIEEINRHKTIILELESRTAVRSVFEDENNHLKNIISQLEQQKSTMVGEIERIRNASVVTASNQQSDPAREIPSLREGLESERRKVEGLRSDMAQLTSENKNLKMQLERNRGAEIKVAALENKINYLTGVINNLEKENRELQVSRNPPVSFSKEQNNTFGSDPQMIARLQENINNLEIKLRQEASKNRIQTEEIHGLKSTIVQLEVQASTSQKKSCPYHSEDDHQQFQDPKILSLFKEKFDEKMKEVAQLHEEIDRLNNQNQGLRTKLNEIEVQFEASKASHTNRDKDLVSMYKLNLEEARIQADYLSKENSKLKDLLRKSDTRTLRTETAQTEFLTPKSSSIDPRVERLILKALLSDFEFVRLKKLSSETTTARFSDKRSPTSFSNLNGPRLEYHQLPESILNSKVTEQAQINGLLFSQESQKLQKKPSAPELMIVRTQPNHYK
jgi:hypothetical protein